MESRISNIRLCLSGPLHFKLDIDLRASDSNIVKREQIITSYINVFLMRLIFCTYGLSQAYDLEPTTCDENETEQNACNEILKSVSIQYNYNSPGPK
jgi:hypothetical protein